MLNATNKMSLIMETKMVAKMLTQKSKDENKANSYNAVRYYP